MAREDRTKRSAQDILDRAERELRTLSSTGMDVTALSGRFEEAKAHFDGEQYTETESLCSEILVLAKSMGAIASASKKATRGTSSGKMSENMKLEVSRIVQSEVANRVESVVRNLPTTSAIEEIIQTKIQEALVTGGLMARLEEIASEQAQAAVSQMPRFTAKDAQAAANLVVQRALTQFLAGKELGKRVKASVEAELGAAVDLAMDRVSKETDALINTRVASQIAPLPTNETLKEEIENALSLYTKTEPFEERVLELAAERAKAEVSKAPEVMAEAAGRIARTEADALFKTKIQGPDFVEQVGELAGMAAKKTLNEASFITQDDVETIARKVTEESFGAEGFDKKVKDLAGEVFGERIAAVEEKIGSVEEKIPAVEEKVTELVNTRPSKEELADEVGKVRQDIMASQDFAEWIKDGVKAILDELELGEGAAGLEKIFVSSEKVERIARHEALTAAMDLLETKEFARQVAALLDDGIVRDKIGEISGGSLDASEVKNVLLKELESPDVIEKVKAATGGDAKELSQRLIERMDRIEKEALPAIVERLLTEKMGAVSEEAIEGKVGEMISQQLKPEDMEAQILKVAQDNIKDIANTPGFKAMLDEKFKVMMKYLTADVIPKQIRKLMGG
jgi:broad-specificity NMP kinase